MSNQAEAEKKSTIVLDASQVAGYLREHPDFFQEQGDLLALLQIPHASGGAVSLVERQISVLRDQNQDLKRKLMELVQVARENDRLNERVQQLILDLIAADSLAQMVDTLNDHLQGEFKADTVSLLLYGIRDEQARECGIQRLQSEDPALVHFESFHKMSQPLCGRLNQNQLEFLFGHQAAAVSSVALVPVGPKAAQGMLAIGSSEAQRFHPGMGTLFLTHLGELLGAFLKPYLQEPATR